MARKVHKNTNLREVTRLKKKLRIRKKLLGQIGRRPRLCVFKSNKYLYAQVVDDLKGCTLVQANTRESEFRSCNSKKNLGAAKLLGNVIGKRSIEKSIDKVVFDRSGYNYHGCVKAIAEGAREAGLKF